MHPFSPLLIGPCCKELAFRADRAGGGVAAAYQSSPWLRGTKLSFQPHLLRSARRRGGENLKRPKLQQRL